jgi:hypothetical protein
MWGIEVKNAWIFLMVRLNSIERMHGVISVLPSISS